MFSFYFFFFFNDTATTEIYTLSLHDALPICPKRIVAYTKSETTDVGHRSIHGTTGIVDQHMHLNIVDRLDRKSTRLNSSHVRISYAVFCLKKKKKKKRKNQHTQNTLITLTRH